MSAVGSKRYGLTERQVFSISGIKRAKSYEFLNLIGLGYQVVALSVYLKQLF